MAMRTLEMVRLSIVGAALVVASAASAGQEKTPPALTFQPPAADFGEQVVGKASKAVRITVTNTGGSDLYVNSVSLDGENRSDFRISNDACTNATLKPGKSCVVDVV